VSTGTRTIDAALAPAPSAAPRAHGALAIAAASRGARWLRRAGRLALASLALVAPAAQGAVAWTGGRPLSLIWKPLPNLPSIVRPGDVLTVWADAPFYATRWRAELDLGALRFPLVGVEAPPQAAPTRWTPAFVVPRGLPEETYDLVLSCATCASDTARHSVKVVPGFRRDFAFAQITDTHLPSHVFSSSPEFDLADTSGMADLDAVIDDLNLIHPEFVLHTGDLVNEGELEDFWDMHELTRGRAMLERLRDPVFLVSGNHDIGGWQATPPPAGTSRRDWWRFFGWPALAAPGGSYPWHSQDYSFDYGPLHVVGLEAYQNDGGYDGFAPEIYGAQSLTDEQLAWLARDLAAVPPVRTRLAFLHYDFGGTGPGGLAAPAGSQLADLAALGLDGAIWGHWHDVPEGDLAARPFNLGLQSVIGNESGGRAFRIFRVHDGIVTPGPMHHAGGTRQAPVDSLQVRWSGPNDGTRAALAATIMNLYGESWDHARLIFRLAAGDSQPAASGGTIAQIVRQGARADVYVDCAVPASDTVTVSVAPAAPAPQAPLVLSPPAPNPFRPGTSIAVFRWSQPAAGPATLGLYDLRGARVATLFDGVAGSGERWVAWDGRADAGVGLSPGIYLARLRAAAGERVTKVVVLK
jgi:hypothetical protein